MKRLTPLIITGLLLAIVTFANAQDQCSALEREAINLVANTCTGLGRNEVCHGYFRVEAQPRDASSPFSFALGEIAEVSDVTSVRTYPFNLDTQEWGIALMNLQANLPDELPGANVQFLLLGDTNVVNTSAMDAPPMQSVRLETGLTGTTCSEAPRNGLLIQTPHGVGRVTLNINSVDISLGSTVFVESHAGGVMTVSTLEGAAYVRVNGMNQAALPGYQVRIAMDEDMNPLGFVGAAAVYQEEAISTLPLSLLEQPVEIVTPLNGPIDIETAVVWSNSEESLETASLGNTADNVLDMPQELASTGGNCGNGAGNGAATCEEADANRENDNNGGGNGAGNNSGGKNR